MRLECGGGLARLAEAVGHGWGVRTSQEGLCFGVEAEPRCGAAHTKVLSELWGQRRGQGRGFPVAPRRLLWKAGEDLPGAPWNE